MEQKQHYYWLDLIRFLAAFAVVACHGRGCFLPEYAALPSDQKNLVTVLFYGLTRLGNEAVICFFILSGFLVGGRGISKMLKGKFDWKSYAIDRFSRIFPPLFGAVLFYMAIFFWRQEEINYLHCLGNLLSLQGIVVLPVSAPFWSLSYEVWFYILLGSVGGFALQKSLSFRYCCFGLLLLCAWIFYRLQAVFLFVWLLGAVTYFLIPHRTCRPVLIAGGLLLIPATVFNQIASSSNVLANRMDITVQAANLVFAAAFSVVITQLVTVIPRSLVWNALNRWGSRLASFSYSLYLTHFITFQALFYLGAERKPKLTAESFFLYVCYLTIALLVGLLIYTVFEKHTLFFRSKLQNLLK